MSKKVMRLLNSTPTKDLPVDLKPLAIRTSCPYDDCQRGMTIGKALNNGVEWGKHQLTDFTCPFCRRTLLLSKPIFGEYYFRKGERNANYSE